MSSNRANALYGDTVIAFYRIFGLLHTIRITQISNKVYVQRTPTGSSKMKKRLTKKLSRDPFLRNIQKQKQESQLARRQGNVSKLIENDTKTAGLTNKEVEEVKPRTLINKKNVQRFMPKTNFQLQNDSFLPLKTFDNTPMLGVRLLSETAEKNNTKQKPIICSKTALNFHNRRLGNKSLKRIDNDYRIGLKQKRLAAKLKLEKL
ncbi:unnamed protein product [Didymodactylos carnosus]|uniref:Uncharacterized protein n=1 Tax=Didymodactylos carnosus TaxID=1234261 RepID=A0A814AHJ1_9BILA|nr:unnamed protein product [Didymodactylos carnosus]CAF0915388.1 unnamed protein product [Didymodactylos carnosus]CAF3534788.1 unnamed protein product [Didymodactylos carnosus]CAF3695668.1 unnamed protein product [Didymodactylos carnosus]